MGSSECRSEVFFIKRECNLTFGASFLRFHAKVFAQLCCVSVCVFRMYTYGIMYKFEATRAFRIAYAVIYSLAHLLIHLYVRSPARSLTRSFVCLLIVSRCTHISGYVIIHNYRIHKKIICKSILN